MAFFGQQDAFQRRRTIEDARPKQFPFIETSLSSVTCGKAAARRPIAQTDVSSFLFSGFWMRDRRDPSMTGSQEVTSSEGDGPFE